MLNLHPIPKGNRHFRHEEEEQAHNRHNECELERGLASLVPVRITRSLRKPFIYVRAHEIWATITAHSVDIATMIRVEKIAGTPTRATTTISANTQSHPDRPSAVLSGHQRDGSWYQKRTDVPIFADMSPPPSKLSMA
jgi:hypothetical protein